ncbi:hypothetical protein EOPP23_18835 [Endozoicomonas sp. OPT23]|nr:hypothetical protein [Endozoicomonas sp. OPT23]
MSESFLIHAHKLTEKYYLKPFPNCVEQPYQVSRPVHGVQHATRGAFHVLHLLALHKEWGNPHARSLTASDIRNLIIAFILHDSGREGDAEDKPEWEAQSALNCFNELMAMGVDETTALMLSDCIVMKDSPDEFKQYWGEKADFFRCLIHDADTLEVIRARRHFDLNFLEIYQAHQTDTEKSDFLVDHAGKVCDAISAQGDQRSDCIIPDPKSSTPAEIHPIKYDTGRKLSFEKSPNCLQAQFEFFARHKPQLYQQSGITKLSAPDTQTVPPDHLTLDLPPAQHSHRYTDQATSLFKNNGIAARRAKPEDHDMYFSNRRKSVFQSPPTSERRPVICLNENTVISYPDRSRSTLYFFDPDLLTPWAVYKRRAMTDDFIKPSNQWRSPHLEHQNKTLPYNERVLEDLADTRKTPHKENESKAYPIKRLVGFNQVFEKIDEQAQRSCSLDVTEKTSGSWKSDKHSKGKVKSHHRLSAGYAANHSEVVCESIEPDTIRGIVHISHNKNNLKSLGSDLAELKQLKENMKRWGASGASEDFQPVLLVHSIESQTLLDAGTFEEVAPVQWRALHPEKIKTLWEYYITAFEQSSFQINQSKNETSATELLAKKIQLLPVKDRIELLRRNYAEQQKTNGLDLITLYLEMVNRPAHIADPDDQESTIQAMTLRYGFTSRSKKDIETCFMLFPSEHTDAAKKIIPASHTVITSEALMEIMPASICQISEQERKLLSYAQLLVGLLGPEKASEEFSKLFGKESPVSANISAGSFEKVHTALQALYDQQQPITGDAVTFRQVLDVSRKITHIPESTHISQSFPDKKEIEAWGIPQSWLSSPGFSERFHHLCNGLVDLMETTGGAHFFDDRTEQFQRFDLRHKLGSLALVKQADGEFESSMLNTLRRMEFKCSPCCWKRMKEQIDQNAVRDLVKQTGHPTDNTGSLSGCELPYDMPLADRLSTQHHSVQTTLQDWFSYVEAHGTPGYVGSIELKDRDRPEVVQYVQEWEGRHIPSDILENYPSTDNNET